MTLNLSTIAFSPQDKEYVKASDFADLSTKIQSNFGLLNSNVVQLSADNNFSGTCTFSGSIVITNPLDIVEVDNIRVDGNTISSTNTNGNINYIPNGTGLNIFGTNMMITPEGGLAIKLINKTGSASVKGTVVTCDSTTDNSFSLQTNEYDSIGAVYQSGIADGQACWVVVAGIAEYLLKDGTGSTRGQVVLAADTDGRAITTAVPSPPTDTNHFKEIGHCLETKSSGTNILFKAVLHFN